MLRPFIRTGFVLILLISLLLPFPLNADELSDRVDKIFAPWDTTVTPGCTLAVVRDGKIIYKRGYGMAKLEDGIAMTTDKVFDIGSVSKQFTAACIVILAKEGKVSLEAEIQQYIPELPRYKRPITLLHLIHHTSGLGDYNELLELAGFRPESDCPTVEEALQVICRQKNLNFLPGEKYSYSNTGYFLLGQVVERVSGKTLNEFARERIFKPLGMIRTIYQDDHRQIIKNRATGYDLTEKGYRIALSNWDMTGDGNVYTSVEDLYLWDQEFYNHNLGRELTDMLHTVGVLNNGKKIEYAFGLRISEYRGLKTVRHSGSWAGFEAALIRFPGQKFSVICLANLSDRDPMSLCLKVADIYLADLLKESPQEKKKKAEPAVQSAPFAPPAAARLKDYAGDYVCEELLGATYRLVVENGNLILKFRSLPQTPLKATAPDKFSLDFYNLNFVRGRGGKITGFRLSSEETAPIEFLKKIKR